MKSIKNILIGLILISTISLIAGNPRSTGDIVARDLKGFAWLGHVGIWDGRRVLEVLDKRRVIQKNSLSSFKRASHYWGARYGKGRRHYKVIRAGWKQRKYSPKYTLTRFWREGKYVKKWKWNSRKRRWVKKWIKQRAKFRCDTFVRYAYLKGIGIDLLRGHTIAPRVIYKSMPRSR